MENSQAYFTPEERPIVLRLVKELNSRLGSQLSCRDINTVHALVKDGIVKAGLFHRDQYGLNPVLRHLNTAVTLCESIAPDRTMARSTPL